MIADNNQCRKSKYYGISRLQNLLF